MKTSEQDQTLPTISLYVILNEEVKGPFTTDQLKALLSVNAITGETKCCHEGSDEWLSVAAYLSSNCAEAGRSSVIKPTVTDNPNIWIAVSLAFAAADIIYEIIRRKPPDFAAMFYDFAVAIIMLLPVVLVTFACVWMGYRKKEQRIKPFCIGFVIFLLVKVIWGR